MHLIVHFDWLRHSEQSDAACGLVVLDQRSARPVHEAGLYLGKLASDQRAAFTALVRAIELAAPMQPEQLDLRCANELLVRQITGEAPLVEQANIDLYQRAITALLRLNAWQIGLIEAEQRRPATELAQRALTEATDITDLSAADVPQLHHHAHTGVPQWTVELLEDPGVDCPARCRPGRRFAFGPDTPAGFCVHAMIVAMSDGPMGWTDPTQQRMTSSCPHCDAPMRIERVGPNEE